MNRVWFTLIALVAIVGLVALVGALLPREHVASRRVRLAQTPQAIYDVISAFADAPSWRKELKSVELLPARDGKPRFREISRFGPMTMLVAVAEPPGRLVTVIDDPKLPFGGSWTFRIDPVEGGAELTITENGEVKNVLFRAMSRFVFGHAATMEGYLRALGTRFGETVEPLPGRPDPPPAD